jgi:hypothetical protein
VARRRNADFDASRTDIEYRYFYFIADDKAFVFFSRKY